MRDEFNDQYIGTFWTPIGSESGVVEELSSNIISCDASVAYSDSACFRTTYPICGPYKVWIKFRVDSATSDSDVITIYDTVNVPYPDDEANLATFKKLILWWDQSEPEMEMQYYDTSNTAQNIDVNISSAEDTWYILYIEKTETEYKITLFSEDMVSISGPHTVGLTTINNGAKPDYLVFGTLATDAQQIDIDFDFIDIKFDLLRTDHLNDIQYFNSIMRGLGL